MTLRRHYLPSHSIIPHVPRTLLQCEREGKVRCEFSVPSVLWIQDDGGITVEGKVVPLVEEARVASVMVKLEQTEAFRTTSKNRYRPSFFVYNHDPRQFLVTPVTPTSYILPSTDLTLPLTAEIPLALHLDIRSPRVKSHVDSPLVDVEHIVRIRVSFIDSAQKPMWLDAPITITTVPAPSDPVLAVFARPNANPGEVLPGYDDLTYHPPPAVEASNPDQATLAGGLPEYSPREIVLSEPIVGTGATPGHLASWRGERGGQVSLLEEGGILGEV
ncbi:hypothetical protein BC938DRAFT_480373 [Jimgerdemannia flammicorona]|uniref:Arrestin-like N-terminal domain-containing protein n=1 Tax=Jimgerdemannia flammicorona TaxID=994334 RepID=A0A433QIQ7_9FUNG|nr:hypothetical protein BC938DRAFT_480373 [Jimgerdemannia flammicorona]